MDSARDLLLEPLEGYKSYYENKFKDNCENYYQDLVKKSGVNVEENRKTVAERKAELAVANDLHKKISGAKSLRGFLIFLIVASVICLAVGIYLLVTSGGEPIPGAIMVPIGAVVLIVCAVVIAKVINPKIKHNEMLKQKHLDKADELLKLAWKQMLPLNRLFESNATKNLIEKTVPLIQIDDNFDMRRYDYLSEKYGFGEPEDTSRSTIAILTGEILGNPFVVDRELICEMGTCTYSGSLVIHWTTTYTDSDGHTHVQHHSQTLVATVVKPKPYFSEYTRLIYGNEAAPDLSFSHEPSHAEQLDEKELARKVKSGAKKIEKLQKKDMEKGDGSFTEMGNEEFDVLFGALDRDNEVQFRLLFTPLAQKNMLSLMKDRAGYGDDFYFSKRCNLNFISSEHSQHWDLDTYYARYQSFDIDASHGEFMTFNAQYFKSLFFDLAPLLSIPLYQQHKPREYIYKDLYYRNYTAYETEYVANKMGQNVFKHPDSATEAILKTSFLAKQGESDKVRITAYSFRGVDRVDYVPTLGGDGHIHQVPVPWIEYIPISRNSTIGLKQLDMTDKDFNNSAENERFKEIFAKMSAARIFAHGLLGWLEGPVPVDYIDAELTTAVKSFKGLV